MIPAKAIQALNTQGVIAYPTEAVWGLGCDPYSNVAVDRILDMKQRHADMGLILIGSDFEQFLPLIAPVTDAQEHTMRSRWPGPITWIVPAHEQTPSWLTGGRDTIALRWTAHPVAAALCDAWDGCIVSTSANRHGHPPARTEVQARSVFGDTVDAYVPGATGGRDQASDIFDLITGKQLR